MEKTELIDLSLQSETLYKATVRIWSGLPGKGGEFLGTAFFVSPIFALTAAHVVENIEKSQLYAQVTWKGGFFSSVKDIIYPSDKRTDAALLKFSLPDKAPVDSILSVGQTLEVGEGGSILMVGFADEVTSVEIRKGSVTGRDGVANATIITPSPARGMSGGPALSVDGLLRGIIWARNLETGRGYLTPISELRGLLDSAAVEASNKPTRMLPYPELAEDRQRLQFARNFLLTWRKKYVSSCQEIKNTAEIARGFKWSTSGIDYTVAHKILTLATSIAYQMSEMSIDKMKFATHYGLRIHSAVFDNFAYNNVLRALNLLKKNNAIDKINTYSFENSARIMEAAICLAEFSPKHLPEGFVDTKFKIDKNQIFQISDKIIITSSNRAEEIFLVSLESNPKLIGVFVARTLPLKISAAKRLSDGIIEVVGNDSHFRYRWSSNSSQPLAQYINKEKVIFIDYPFDTPGTSPIIATSDGLVSELCMDGSINPLSRLPQSQEWISGALWSNPQDPDVSYLIYFSKNGEIISTRLDKKEKCTNISCYSLVPDLELNEYFSRKDLTKLQMTSVDGFPCANFIFQVSDCTLLIFLDPITLIEIIPAIKLPKSVNDVKIYDQDWLIVSFYERSLNESLIEIYKINGSLDSPIRTIKCTTEDGDEVDSLFPRRINANSFEIWFTLGSYKSDTSWRLCRWNVLDENFQEFPDISAKRFLPA